MTRECNDESETSLFAIYSTENDKCIVVQSSLSIQILNMLQKENMTLSQINKSINKPISSLFKELDQLVSLNLISQVSDNTDGRKKIYFLNSRKLVESTDRGRSDNDSLANVVDDITDGKMGFYQSFSMIIMSVLDNNFISIEPGIYNIGTDIGEAIWKKSKFDSIDDLIMFITEFYQEIGAGIVTLYSMMPLTLIITGFDDKPKTIRSAWKLIACGMMECLIYHITGTKYTIEVSEMDNKDKQCCKYRFDIVKQ